MVSHQMSENDWLADRFEQHRRDLTAVAYRLLGSRSDADDAVQEAWLRLTRSHAEEIENLGAWLTTVVSRIALNMLKARAPRREEPLDTVSPPSIVDDAEDSNPEQEALLADSVGLALLVVLETLTPPERLAFVLHDMFALPFDEIADILERSPDATRQLASRARRRVRGVTAPSGVDRAAERRVIDAFLAAARDGDFDALVAVLDPDIALRAITGPGQVVEVQGAQTVARRALGFAQRGLEAKPAVINGSPGWVGVVGDEIFSASEFTVRDGRIAAMNFISDRDRIQQLDIAFLDEGLSGL
jgi:RNA polymerase sigma factor (sigma-70 family)